MRLRPIHLAVVLCLLTLPVHGLDIAECGVIEEQAFTVIDAEFDIEVTQSATSQAHALPNGCASSDLDIYVGPLGLWFRAERVVFTGDNLLPWVRGEVVLPTALRLRVDGGMLMERPAAPPALAWISGLASEDAPAQIDLQFVWHPATQSLSLDFLRVVLDDDSSATMSFSGRAAGWAPYDTPAANFGITDLALDFNFNGMFEAAVVAPMAANGLDTTPFTFSMMAAGVQSLTQSAPADVLPPTSGAALNAFALTMPHPRGRLRLGLRTPQHFNVNEVLLALRTGVPFDVVFPRGVTLSSTWEPQP